MMASRRLIISTIVAFAFIVCFSLAVVNADKECDTNSNASPRVAGGGPNETPDSGNKTTDSNASPKAAGGGPNEPPDSGNKTTDGGVKAKSGASNSSSSDAKGGAPKGNAGRACMEATNAHRAKKGLPKLEWNDDVAKQTDAHAQLQASTDKMGHDGQASREAALKKLPNGGYYAENAGGPIDGKRSKDPKELGKYAVELWIESPEHRANIEKPHKFMACSFKKSGKGWYASQIFSGQ